MTQSEENYLKAIFKIAEFEKKSVSTNSIARQMNTSAASVTDMIRKLAAKNLINYKKYAGVTLTELGSQVAIKIVRKHRLWEVFLFEKLEFSWDEVHEIAEQLEHVQSLELVKRLDNYLGNPKFDPHGDPIPNAEGKFTLRNQVALSKMKINEKGKLIGVKSQEKSFLKYLDDSGLQLGCQLRVIQVNDFDASMTILTEPNKTLVVSAKTAQNLLLKKSVF